MGTTMNEKRELIDKIPGIGLGFYSFPFNLSDIVNVEQHHQCTRLYTRNGRMWTILRTKGKYKLSKKVKQLPISAIV